MSEQEYIVTIRIYDSPAGSGEMELSINSEVPKDDPNIRNKIEQELLDGGTLGGIPDWNVQSVTPKGESEVDVVFLVKDIETNEITRWTLDDILFEINRDHSAEFSPYNKSDFMEGWHEWCEGDYVELIGIENNKVTERKFKDSYTPAVKSVITEKEACEFYKQVNPEWDRMDDCLMIDFMCMTMGYNSGMLKKEQTLIFYK